MIAAIMGGSMMKNAPWSKIVIGLIIGLVIYLIYRQGKKSGQLGKPKASDIPKDWYGAGGGVLLDGDKVSRIAHALHDDMKGANMTYKESVYEEFAQLSDTEFVSVNNFFNDKFYQEEQETLKEWIKDQWFGLSSFTLPTLIDDVILPRMGRLNLD